MNNQCVRKVVTRSGYGSMRGYFPSRMMKRSVGCESKLEMEAAALFEMTPGVVSYREQPATIHFFMDGKMHRYVPDFEVQILENGQIKIYHVEIKPHKILLRPKIKERFDAIEQHYKEHMDVEFVVLTDQELHNENYLNNIRLLKDHYRWKHDDAELRDALETLTILNPLTIGGANVILGNEQHIYRLLAAGVYDFDVFEPLNTNTRIYPTVKEAHHA